MSRLIDADELKRALADMWYESAISITGVSVSELIDNAPTIEPSKSTDQNVADVPSGETISREDAIAYIDRVTNSGLGKNKSLDYIRKHISALPSADRPSNVLQEKKPTPIEDYMTGKSRLVDRPKGEWTEKEVMVDEEENITEWQSARCSVCGRYHTTPYMYYFDNFNFCPNCGADMRGGAE